ncbi:MAG: hypothetical protein DRQ39_03330 [Gammaproteobacteria bacterium]|nr:MAG: hypothetical protein DRQ39_03330 [Gammaproteobacteria bacterium]RKZ94370.1 MAG: hypothetical protein DRQ40_05995 [Gammaproteobacteria bacterium]RKZ98678.1 MAG: hypothetical protein DRQ46_01370 [Gammaproteobacteria bacterium]RLA01360.1 MAG: hypothetical protein DRQ42_03390 [Gammaproteobacteria bacterium]
MTDSFSTDNSNQVIHFDSREHVRELALELAQQARREICFFGNTIDHVLFDDVSFIDCLSEFARRNNKTAVKFLIHSSQTNIQTGHRIIPLAQRLTSSIDIRTTAKQHQNLVQMFMLVDTNGYLYCQNYQRYQGRACFYDPAQVRSLKHTFDDMWNHSLLDSSMRRLHL